VDIGTTHGAEAVDYPTRHAQQQEDPLSAQLSFEERFAMLVGRQWNWRQSGSWSDGYGRAVLRIQPA